jgi:predicted RNase H-like nuclease (RuvC/YqgF family)
MKSLLSSNITTMRTTAMRFCAAALLAVSLAGCSKCSNNEAQIAEQISSEKGALQTERDRTDSLYRSALKQVDEMMTVLTSLEAEEGIVRVMGPEAGESAAAFKQRMEEIAKRMNEKTTTIRKQAGDITALKQRLASTEAKLAAVTKRADSLAALVSSQQTEIVGLRQQLSNARKSIDSLKQRLAEKDAIIATKVRDLNRAYYIVAPRNDLYNKGIIDKQGQFLFFGGRIAVKQNFDTRDFSRVDITEAKDIEIKVAKDNVTLISNHDADSFELVANGDASVLKIKDPERFWKNAKYLVVMTD